MGFRSKGLKKEFETAVVNEPSAVFEPLRVLLYKGKTDKATNNKRNNQQNSQKQKCCFGNDIAGGISFFFWRGGGGGGGRGSLIR